MTPKNMRVSASWSAHRTETARDRLPPRARPPPARRAGGALTAAALRGVSAEFQAAAGPIADYSFNLNASAHPACDLRTYSISLPASGRVSMNKM